ncbi:SRPBCC family protein [Bradyrhizobium canariense]|uniref:SRPBCC family protein n=1 Tax=Bradyrhizobium canariense TaxID=255045 RepID=UPI0011BA8916|nr:SRPBCC family protein [Bradyrhizobium canariense]
MDIELKFEADIHASTNRVFSLLADLRDYDRWLPKSSAFHGTVAISEGPMAVGTTYVEPGPFGTRHGTVAIMDRSTRLAFEQPMTLRPRALGVIGIKLLHTLTPDGSSVHLVRELTLSPQGPIKLAMPFVERMFRVENERMMQTLKTYAEANPA